MNDPAARPQGAEGAPGADRSRPSTSPATRLARLGFTEPARAVERLGEPGLAALAAASDAVDDLALAADPDLALASLARIAESASDASRREDVEGFLAAVARDPGVRRRAYAVLGLSEALGDHLARHPEHGAVLGDPDLVLRSPGAGELRADLLAAVGADPAATVPTATIDGVPALDAMRVAYRRRLLALAARDLAAGESVDAVSAELADLADAALETALAIARAELPADAEPVRLAVIGMGKCGGRELNYVSDVDVVFVAEAHPGGDEEAALRSATRLATSLMNACVTATGEGSLWEVDAALRPEGRAGALVRTLRSHVGYYERWASTWEFQALLKARPSAGDPELGAAYVDAVLPFVWSAADRDGFVGDVQAMRRRVEGALPASQAGRELKLGPGGLRDVEFAVQLLQLVHGRSDVMVRSRTTLVALESLATWGYVGRDDAATLGEAYRFERTLEHSIQLHRLRRTHLVPEAEADLRRLGRALGYRTDPVAELDTQWRRHTREVRRLHEKLFYRPLLNAVARLDAGEARLTPEAAAQRLEALGYVDPEGALRHLEALTSGVSRRAAIQRTLLPVLLGWFADAPDPDAGLLGFRRVSDALGATHWYLGLLRDESAAAERMARLLSSSRYVTDLLLRAPEAVTMLADPDELTPRPATALLAESSAAAARQLDPVAAVNAVRAVRRRELFRIATADLLGEIDVDQVGVALSDVTATTLSAALQAAERAVAERRGAPLPMRLAVIAMGRFGGAEVGYGSDADVMFVHEALPGSDEREAGEAAVAVAGELRTLLMSPSTDPPLEIDADLRPEGRQGALSRSLASYRSYYERWSLVWESQALLRARPVAGDAALGEQFVGLVAPLRYPVDGLADPDVREIRRIKARIEAERLPRGADPALHTKLGPGGLSDVEWLVQSLALQHAGRLPSLRTTRTLDGLAASVAEGLLTASDAEVLSQAWVLCSRVRNGLMLGKGRPGDMLPTDTAELRVLAHLLGYAPGQTGRLVDDYRRATRRSRAVVERVFYA